MIEIRKQYKVVDNGEYNPIELNNPHVFAYSRENSEEKMVVISSFSNKERKFNKLKELKYSDVILSNYNNSSNVLQPFETRVYLIKKH